MSTATVSVIPAASACRRAAAEVAERFGLSLGDSDADVHLIAGDDGLSLRVAQGELARGKPVRCDWSRRDATSPIGARLTQPLLKAVGIRKGDDHRPTVIDAAAGFGDDAYLLAAMGCRVTAIERHPALAAMLTDAAERRLPDPPPSQVADPPLWGGAEGGLDDATPSQPPPERGRGSLNVVHGDSIDLLGQMQAQVVYLDPMFPSGRKTVERKPMRVLRHLVGDDDDADALFAAALQAATKRVVVKRPLRAPWLADTQPKVSHKGQAVRYDVYIPAEVMP